MDLRQLHYFATVAERGGFGAAAGALNVAQSALSRHVKLLEQELGGALLVRGPRGVTVTEAGKVLLDRGRWLLGMLEDIKVEVMTENREPSGTVRLGAPSSLADLLYAPLARKFARRFPRVRLELSEGLTESLTDRLLRSELDVAVVTMPRANDHLAYETLAVEQVFLVGAPGDRLLKRGTLTRQQFNGLSSSIQPLSRSYFPPGVSCTVRVESATSMKQMVAAGLGYALLPFSGIYREVEDRSLSAARLPWMQAERVLALPRGRPISSATREVVASLKEICRELIEAGRIRTARQKERLIAAKNQNLRRPGADNDEKVI
jgi:LysR family transcriptional regulator, nitrogen assimilation regulatory protein